MGREIKIDERLSLDKYRDELVEELNAVRNDTEQATGVSLQQQFALALQIFRVQSHLIGRVDRDLASKLLEEEPEIVKTQAETHVSGRVYSALTIMGKVGVCLLTAFGYSDAATAVNGLTDASGIAASIGDDGKKAKLAVCEHNNQALQRRHQLSMQMYNKTQQEGGDSAKKLEDLQRQTHQVMSEILAR